MEILGLIQANLLGIGAMILGLMFLILVHEFGHWIVARMFGFKTPVFSIGFGKKEWSLVLGKFWDTEFRIAPIMLGGYVSIPELADESMLAASKKDKSKAAETKDLRVFPVWKRQCVAVAGVVMNVITAFVILASMFYFIGKPAVDITATKVGAFSNEITIAQDAGLEVGDKFISVDGVKVVTPEDLTKQIGSHKSTEILVVVERNSKPVEITVTPNADGKIGIGLDIDYVQRYEKQSFMTSVSDGAKTTGVQIVGMVKGIGMMVGLVDPPANAPEGATDVHGVVAIVQIGADAFGAGAFQFLWIVAMISLNLAILNILPIPLLDGGHMLFYTLESIRGKPVSVEFREKLYRFFFMLLIMLMFYGLFNDIFNPVKM